MAVKFCGERLCCGVMVAQNLSQSKPFLSMKVVMSWKAWWETGCAMAAYGGWCGRIPNCHRSPEQSW